MLPKPQKRLSLKQWEKLMEAGDPATQNRSLGPSPGGAAATLGITRQAVHELIRKGRLQAMGVYEGEKLRFYLVDPASLESYRQERTQALLTKLKRLG